MLSSITRFPGGVGNSNESSGLADLKIPNPLTYSLMYDDFNAFTVGEWTLAGTGAAALQANGDGGIVALTTSGTINTDQSMAFGAPNLTVTPNIGKDLFVAARIQMDDVVNGGFFFGLGTATPAPLAAPPTAGIYFRKLTGSATGKFNLRIGGVNIVDIDLPVVANATWYDLVIAYTAADGLLRGFVNNAAFRAATSPASLGTVPLGLIFAARTGTAAIRTMLIDNYLVAKGR
jgi:hypothetical protein